MKFTHNKFNDTNEIARVLKALSEPNRLMILEKIADGIQCNCELGSALNMAPNLISHHLSVLRDAGLIITTRSSEDARWVYFTMNENTFKEIRSFFNHFFDPDRIKPRNPACGPIFEKKEV
jgi:ArsR family transcriptional regulator